MIFLIGGDLDFYDYPLDPKELEKERIHSRIKMDAVKHPKAPPLPTKLCLRDSQSVQSQ